MKRQTFLKSTLCLLMALVCNVSWAQTSSWFKMGASTTSLSDGDYVLVAKSDKGTGPVFYDPSVGKPYRYDVSKTVAEGHVVPSKYVWTIDETTIDGVQHITVTNHDDNTKAFPVDGAKNQNFTGSGTASLKTEMYTADGVDYIVLTLDNEAIGYVHANAPGGNPCLSYWNTNGDGTSCIKFTFFPVNALTDDELAERLTYNVGDGKYNDRSGSSWRNGWTSTNVGKPSFTISVGANNMNAGVTEYIGMRPGASGCTYTLTLGETFTGYSFEAMSTNTAPNTNNPVHVITINGKETTISSTEWTTVRADVVGTTASFGLKGSNNHDLYIRNVKFEQNADALETINAAVTANANMDIYGLQRHYGLVQNADMYECNYPSNPADGQGYPALIDGNYDTYFHSGYSGRNPSPSGVAHYLQADLGKAVKSFRFYFKKRKQNNANRPTKITIEGSNDKEDWAAIQTISSGFPTDANVLDYYSDVIVSNTAYQYLRFTVNSTSGGTEFFTFSEFYILPTYVKVNEAFNAVRTYRAASPITVAVATALNEAYAWNTGLTKGTPIIGADHYIYADTKQSDGSYVARYLFNNNGSLATNTSLNTEDDMYVWTVAQPEGTEYYTLQNVGDNAKYISYGNNGNGLGVGETAVLLDIKSSEAVHAGSVGIKRIGTDTGGKYMVTSANGSSFNRNSVKVNNGSWCSDYVFIPADLYSGLYTLTIAANTSKADAVFTWNGYEVNAGSSVIISSDDIITNGALGVKSCNPTYKFEGFYSDAAYKQKITEVGALTGDMTVYAKFVLDIFGEQYGDKWVNIVRATNANHAIILGSDAENTIPTFNTFSYTNAGVVWSLVGTAESFKIYSMLSGNKLALTPNATPADGVAVKMVPAANAASWHLIEKGEAFAITPVDNNNWGINSYTGNAGSQIKFYGVNDSGTHWNFTAIDASKPFTISVAVTGEQPHANNTRVAHLNTTINGAASNTIVKGSVEALTYYLPVGATFTLNNSFTYRGYTFDGFLDAEGNAAEYTNAILPEGGLNITATYSVDEDNKYQYLFYYRDDVNNKPYRIPAITTARNNTVLAFSDYRPCGNDIGYGEVDIMLRRSYDNGQTWSEPVTIADGQGGSSNVFNAGFGDAAVVADRESDMVLVMAVAGKQVYTSGSANSHNSMARIISTDNGESWNEPENVSNIFFGAESLFPEAYTMFFGSGRILQSRIYKKPGAQYYRLYGALLVKHANSTYTGDCNYVVYSDDFGATWNILGGSVENGMCCNGGNEDKVEELPDGSIVLSSRKYNGRYFNVFTFTDKEKGLGTWGSAVASNNQTGGISFGGNSCNGEIYKVKAIHESGRICDVMLQSIPTGSGRSNVSVYYKEMDYTEPYTPTTFAQNWTKGLEVSDMESAYSTMTLQADGNFGFFFEEWPDANYAYSMVYVPLSLEEMTNGAYSLYTVRATITDAKYGTFYASEAMQIPKDVKAYTGKVNGEYLILKEIADVIPANTGVVLYSETEYDDKLIPSISYGTPVENNAFRGSDYAVSTDDVIAAGNGKVPFTLQKPEGYENVVFMQYTGETLAANKAYLELDPAVAKSISIRFEGTTDIEHTEIRNQHSEIIYDLQGRRVLNPTKGIYIVNGKKVVIK